MRPLKKWKCQKCQRLTHFLTSNYIHLHNKFVIEKWVNRRHFFIDEKNLQKFSLTGEYICLIILHDYSFFLESIFGVTIG